MEQVMRDKITVRQAAEVLGLSRRRVKRLIVNTVFSNIGLNTTNNLFNNSCSLRSIILCFSFYVDCIYTEWVISATIKFPVFSISSNHIAPATITFDIGI